jgi:basic membrane protein A
LVEERVGDAVHSTFTGLKDGTLSWGQNVVLGLAEGVVGLTYDGAGDVVPQAVRDEVDAYSQRVVDFDIQVPES